MSNSTPGNAAGTTALTFQAPPAPPVDLEDSPGDDRHPGERPPRSSSGGDRRSSTSAGPGGSLRMLKGARQAAAGMHISDEQIRAVLEDPQDVQPDPNQPTRTRLRRDGVVVTTGNDGMILRVTRRR